MVSDSIIVSTGIMLGSCWNCGVAIQVKYTATILYRIYACIQDICLHVIYV